MLMFKLGLALKAAQPLKKAQNMILAQNCIDFTICILLLDFSLTVKAATLIFISGRGSAISSAK